VGDSLSNSISDLLVGYVPYNNSFDLPGDRRRFVYYASKRGIKFEIADPQKKYDLVILSARADISVWSQYPEAKLVYDLIDSYLAIPRTNLKGLLRGLFKFLSRQSRYLQLDHWKAIGVMCRRADAVVCSTEEQRADILKYCPNVHIILDAQTAVTRTFKSEYKAGRPFRLVWEGLPQTLGSLKLIRSVLDILHDRYSVELHIVTDKEYYRYLGQYGKISTLKAIRRIFPKAILHEWNEVNCSNIICSCDLAIIPLPLEDPFSAGKPENKLLLFWRMGMPVVTSASPAYVRTMQAAGMKAYAKDEADWLNKMESLISNQEERRQAGIIGKKYADREFSEETLLSKWDEVFFTLGFNFNTMHNNANEYIL